MNHTVGSWATTKEGAGRPQGIAPTMDASSFPRMDGELICPGTGQVVTIWDIVTSILTMAFTLLYIHVTTNNGDRG